MSDSDASEEKECKYEDDTHIQDIRTIDSLLNDYTISQQIADALNTIKLHITNTMQSEKHYLLYIKSLKDKYYYAQIRKVKYKKQYDRLLQVQSHESSKSMQHVFTMSISASLHTLTSLSQISNLVKKATKPTTYSSNRPNRKITPKPNNKAKGNSVPRKIQLAAKPELPLNNIGKEMHATPKVTRDKSMTTKNSPGEIIINEPNSPSRYTPKIISYEKTLSHSKNACKTNLKRSFLSINKASNQTQRIDNVDEENEIYNIGIETATNMNIEPLVSKSQRLYQQLNSTAVDIHNQKANIKACQSQDKQLHIKTNENDKQIVLLSI